MPSSQAKPDTIRESGGLAEPFRTQDDRIRVMVVDDAPMWREALRADLDVQPGVVVVAEAADGAEALSRAREVGPDVVLMDLTMPEMNGTEATREIVSQMPSARILVLSQVDEDEEILNAVKAGAVGYLLKGDTTSAGLADAIHRVAHGEMIFTPSLAGLVLDELQHPAAAPTAASFSDRERQVLRMAARGHTEPKIASELHLTLGEVRNQLRSVTFKLQREHTAHITTDHRDGGRPRLPADRVRRRPSGDRPALPRDLSGSARFWIVMIGLLLLAPLLDLWATSGMNGGYQHGFNVWMLHHAGVSPDSALAPPLRVTRLLGSPWTIGALRAATILVLIFYKRWQHLVAFLASILVVGGVVSVTAGTSVAHLPAVVSTELASSRAVAGLTVTLIGIAYSVASAGRPRQVVLAISSALIVLLGLAELSLGLAATSAVLTAVIVGVAVPLLTFRIVAPERSFPVTYHRGTRAHLAVEGPRGVAIREAMHDQLGVTVLDVTPFGEAGSGGSTPLRIRVAGTPDTDLFGKLYATTHLRSDRLYKLGRMILYGSLEDEKPFNSVRRLAEYEDYVLRLLASAGIASAEPYGVVELTPEREYLLITEFLDGTREIMDERVEVDARVVHEALGLVRRLWDAGLAHRDVKPSNVLVGEDAVYLIDAAFAQVRPSPWRQAVDLANMMLVLGVRADPDLVYDAATELFSSDEIAEAFAATRGVTIPSQLRTAIRESGVDLIGRFRALAPERDPIHIQRWSIRRVVLTMATLWAASVTALLVWSNLHSFGLR